MSRPAHRTGTPPRCPSVNFSKRDGFRHADCTASHALYCVSRIPLMTLSHLFPALPHGRSRSNR